MQWLNSLTPYVRECGNHRRPAWHIGPRKLLDYLLVYIADGYGRFVIGEATYAVKPGDLYWIPPRVLCEKEGYAPSMLCPFVHFDLVYRPGISERAFSTRAGTLDLTPHAALCHPHVDNLPFATLCGQIKGYTNRRVGTLIDALCAEAARAQPYTQVALRGLLLEILAEILRGQMEISGDHQPHIPLLEEAAADMTRRCDEALQMEDVAATAGLSVSYFRRLFRRHIGCSPRTFLRRARIDKSKDLMMCSVKTLTEIASLCGFGTVHNYSRAFREVEGISPSEFRSYGSPATKVVGRPWAVDDRQE